ncbi:hypothetical protein HanXRQr2_Chr06g0239671 [Helianthus annuus]|uniref:Uncharacterized protein n=1 Tax=Helianthus annuus TaxID=4232 RepID=A0A251UEQ6_HELAN|nr:hypothetical protein HanXRQr2_Chr06g0239671 [Helianthus annuus]KAJ0933282.1 hypothetical protein HanPSC8_Chr04g0183051 [Helianthus annuus]
MADHRVASSRTWPTITSLHHRHRPTMALLHQHQIHTFNYQPSSNHRTSSEQAHTTT